MITRIITLLAMLVGAVGQVFAWLNSPRREANKRSSDKQKMAEDIYKGDTDKVNEHLKDLLSLVLVLVLPLAAGCVTKTVYVPSNLKATPCVQNGVQGYFITNEMMVLICDKLYDAKYPKAK